jgi:hypothetical protein
MCGKCGKFVGMAMCAGTQGVGVILVALGALSRIMDKPIMGHTCGSFAVAAVLMLLMSISFHLCKMTCMSHCEEEPHTH